MKESTKVISHTLGQSIINVDGNEARGETFFIALMTADADDGMPGLNQLAGRFADKFERIGGSWKIKRRVAVHDISISLRIEEDDLETNQLTRGARDINDPGAALLSIAHKPSSSVFSAADSKMTLLHGYDLAQLPHH